MNKTYKKAFSLIELSIVILIIGILVAGITSGGRIISASGLASARNLTTNSPVIATSNLVVWLETTSKDSFSESESADGAAVTTWKSINTQLQQPLNAVSVASPAYTRNGINGLPALKFDGVDDMMSAPSPRVDWIGGNFTIFVVASLDKDEAAVNGAGLLSNRFGASASNWWTIGIQGNNIVVEVSAVPGSGSFSSSGNPKGKGALIYQFNKLGNTTSLIVPSLNINLTNNTSSKPLGSDLNELMIGRFCNCSSLNFWKGYIGEIIIYNRTLTSSEQTAITQYLSDKWKIKI